MSIFRQWTAMSNLVSRSSLRLRRTLARTSTRFVVTLRILPHSRADHPVHRLTCTNRPLNSHSLVLITRSCGPSRRSTIPEVCSLWPKALGMKNGTRPLIAGFEESYEDVPMYHITRLVMFNSSLELHCQCRRNDGRVDERSTKLQDKHW